MNLRQSSRQRYMFDVIIVTHNARDKLKLCLDSVNRHTQNCAVTVVDNNSRDGTRTYLRSLRGAGPVRNSVSNGVNTIFAKTNLGFCAAANRALKHTRNKFIVFLDDDAEVTAGWLVGLYQAMKNKPKVGIVGCKIVSPDQRIMAADYRVKPLYLVGSGEIDRGQKDYIKECDALVGACWLMRREVFNKIGGFDERFFPSQHEDIDYCLRARLAGYKIIYNGKVRVIHHHLYRDGGEAYGRKNWHKFLRKWKSVLDKFPLKDSHPVDKCMAYGDAYLNQNKPQQALAQFRKAAAYNRKFREPFYEGVALTGMGRYNEAIKKYSKALLSNPLDMTVRYHLALVYRRAGLIKEAKKESLNVLPHLLSYKNKCFVE